MITGKNVFYLFDGIKIAKNILNVDISNNSIGDMLNMKIPLQYF